MVTDTQTHKTTTVPLAHAQMVNNLNIQALQSSSKPEVPVHLCISGVIHSSIQTLRVMGHVQTVCTRTFLLCKCKEPGDQAMLKHINITCCVCFVGVQILNVGDNHWACKRRFADSAEIGRSLVITSNVTLTCS